MPLPSLWWQLLSCLRPSPRDQVVATCLHPVVDQDGHNTCPLPLVAVMAMAPTTFLPASGHGGEDPFIQSQHQAFCPPVVATAAPTFYLLAARHRGGNTTTPTWCR